MSTIRVLKLGGSLLLLPDWPQRLQCWLSANRAPLNFLLVGGGEIVDSVRHLDDQHHFPLAFSHWLCIDLLSATARIAAQLLPEFPLITTSEQLQQIVLQQPRGESTAGQPPYTSADSENSFTFLVDVASFYERTSAQLAMVPENWDTTSDSLAAWLVRTVAAQELVLFKSLTPAAECNTPRAWAEQGIVDAAFTDVLPASVSVQIVNFLSEKTVTG